MTEVKKQYGIWTGIAMVIGIVIGSGVFIKSGKVLEQTAGDLKYAILAWFIGGLIMVCSGFCFAVFATRVTKFNGVVDYIEVSTNKKVGYVLAWCFTTFYYPIIASIVALNAGKYFFELVGLTSIEIKSLPNFIFAFIVLLITTLINYFSPKLSAKFQISSTAIKLIPIFGIVIAGLFASLLVEGAPGILGAFKNTCDSFKQIQEGNEIVKYTVFDFGKAVTITAFAYEGWVCATAINAELKDSKKNLPRALVFGTIAVLLFYIIYFIGLSSILGNEGLLESGKLGDKAPMSAFSLLFGAVGSKLFTAFIIKV